MSVAMQRLVDFISMVTNSTLLLNNTGANSTLLRNNTRAVTTMDRNCDFCWVRPNITTRGSNTKIFFCFFLFESSFTICKLYKYIQQMV
jgi:hypothetical protein